jgi:DNA-binding transcriptional LysR family regulator
VKALTLSGHGIALLPIYGSSTEIESGKLIRVLPAWHSRIAPLHLVYPGQKFVAPKVRAFVEMALEFLKRAFQE